MAFARWSRRSRYVAVEKRRAKAERKMQILRKKGKKIEPVDESQHIQTFWGKVWCKQMEQFSTFVRRLPRGQSYVRNGLVCHLAISKGKIEAIVSGSELYKIVIRVAPLAPDTWKNLREQCAGQIGSTLELLQGRLSRHAMNIVADPNEGLFPKPSDIMLTCNCPDWEGICKHVTAVIYGTSVHFDQHPELLFLLRGVDHEELVTTGYGTQQSSGMTT